MKVDFNYEEVLILLRTLRSEYGHLKAFYAENPGIEAMITPEEVRRVHNKILSEAHKAGDYTFINPIVTN
ncbi:hypothetical protein CPJCM30710_10850 [Clostridium polyendosporum]|uniref:Uncharacterized protein n=1 Tax=Clostridium polyendosporum TaxID=69208 RepID=A0A919RY55_9CLOT|nr:hypothetical protein [Clostridium polyendosporum]GIM28419.1 hypothetical protein CPJCM30710_10850 [Clostridium polyendosporum]